MSPFVILVLLQINIPNCFYIDATLTIINQIDTIIVIIGCIFAIVQRISSLGMDIIYSILVLSSIISSLINVMAFVLTRNNAIDTIVVIIDTISGDGNKKFTKNKHRYYTIDIDKTEIFLHMNKNYDNFSRFKMINIYQKANEMIDSVLILKIINAFDLIICSVEALDAITITTIFDQIGLFIVVHNCANGNKIIVFTIVNCGGVAIGAKASKKNAFFSIKNIMNYFNQYLIINQVIIINTILYLLGILCECTVVQKQTLLSNVYSPTQTKKAIHMLVTNFDSLAIAAVSKRYIIIPGFIIEQAAGAIVVDGTLICINAYSTCNIVMWECCVVMGQSV